VAVTVIPPVSPIVGAVVVKRYELRAEAGTALEMKPPARWSGETEVDTEAAATPLIGSSGTCQASPSSKATARSIDVWIRVAMTC